jgi:hypothetical protein
MLTSLCVCAFHNRDDGKNCLLPLFYNFYLTIFRVALRIENPSSFLGTVQIFVNEKPFETGRILQIS